MWLTFGAALVACASVVIVIAQNGNEVRLSFLGWHLKAALIVVILATAVVAVMVDEAGGLIWRRRRRSRSGRRGELADLQDRQQPTEEAPAVSARALARAVTETSPRGHGARVAPGPRP